MIQILVSLATTQKCMQHNGIKENPRMDITICAIETTSMHYLISVGPSLVTTLTVSSAKTLYK
jgi:hypothetical protein